MDSVPFAFCDDVALTIAKIPSLKRVKFAESAWKSAFADHYAYRMNLSLKVRFADGKWFYTLQSCSLRCPYTPVPVDPQKVQKTCRKYVRLRYLSFEAGASGSASSLDEIRSILKLLRPPVVDDAWLWLGRTGAPKEVIVELFLPFHSAPFRAISLSDYEEAFGDLLKKQIELDTLKELQVSRKCPPAVELKSAYVRIQYARRG